MKNLYGKLNNNEGKTILMALFLLLVAVVVSVVIITAASTAAHQLNDNREAQQAYLTVSSAAQLFRDETESRKYEHTLKEYTRRDHYAPNRNDESSETRPAGAFKKLLTEVATDIKNGAVSSSEALYKETTVNIKSSDADGFDTVNVKIYIQPITVDDKASEYSYNLDITFEVAGKSKDEYGYKLNLSLPVTKSVEKLDGLTDDTKYYVSTTTTTVTFGSGIISKGAGQ